MEKTMATLPSPFFDPQSVQCVPSCLEAREQVVDGSEETAETLGAGDGDLEFVPIRIGLNFNPFGSLVVVG